MPRLQKPYTDTIPEDSRTFLAQFPPDEMFQMLSHSPAMVQPFIRLGLTIYSSLHLPVRTREVAILALASAVQSEFVFAQHIPISEKAGVTERIREMIRDQNYTNPALPEEDRAVIQFTAELIEKPHMSDEVFASARKFLSDREIVELLQVCGYYWTLSRLCTVLQVETTQMYDEISVEGLDR
ncbi:MAG: hypothetical protein JWP83_1944 [Mycobacterium sp.]|uniref:carboxymuconolactone decarboxylase family protein n=1 Tax=Mycobacterium sp. TaxID=1785 RepID=UPI00261A98F8|nr:hypothetical protein [Mycobacterium sp.]MCW2660792.1 hypothetical protein [Mycobacterium sp.]